MTDNFLVRSARLLGEVRSAYYKAAGMNDKKRPGLFTGLVRADKWKGGQNAQDDLAQKRAIRNNWFFTGVQEKALDLAASKMDIFSNPTGEEDGGDKAIGHPFYQVLKRPNPYFGQSLHMQYTEWWLELSGEAYWFLEPDVSGGIKRIWGLPSNAMDLEYTEDDKDIKNFILKLDKSYYIDPRYICYFRLPNPFSFFRGLSPLVAHLLTIDIDLAMKVWNGSFFGKDNVMPSAIISLGSGDPNNAIEQKDIDTVTDQLKSDYQAIKRKTVVTNANSMTVALLGYNAKDMDFLAGMQWNKEEILIALGVPPGMLDKNATEANATVSKAVFKEHMWGLKGVIADEITNQILVPHYSEELEARYKDDRIVDRKLQIAEAKLAEQAMTMDEYRSRFFELDPFPTGEKTVTQFNMPIQPATPTPGDNSGNPKPNDKQPNANMDNTGKQMNDKSKTPVDASVKSVEDVLSEVDSFMRKSINWYKNKGTVDNMKFFSNVLDEDTIKAILLDLSGAENQKDIGDIFAHWREDLAESFFHKSLGDRLWSSLESLLSGSIFTALQQQLDYLLANTSKTMVEDATVWKGMSDIIRTAMEPKFQEIASKAVADVQKMIGGASVSYDLMNLDAQNWATVYAATEIKNIDDTTKDAVRLAIQDWQSNERELGIQGLKNRISDLKDKTGVPLFSKERADRIARSEATSIYAGGTERSLVNNGYPPTVFKPRAHVNCRCYIQPGQLPNGDKVIIWYTVRDEMVCKMPLDTPFGQVIGCKDLHRTIVSEGHAGEQWTGNLWNPETSKIEE